MSRETTRFYAARAGGSGDRYHKTPQCNGLNSSSMAGEHEIRGLSRSEVARLGLVPCKVCKPSPAGLLRVVS